MGLFDSEDNSGNAEFPESADKSRLFDTLKGEGRSLRDYLKVLVPVVIAVLVLGAVVVYFTKPGVGDEVRPPVFLDDAVRNHFQEKEKREVMEATYFLCDGFYWARVKLEKRSDITARQMDEGHRYAAAVAGPSDTWQITSTPSKQTDPPCTR